VADAQRVQRFDAGGTYQLGRGSAGTGNGQFTRIADLKVGSTGTVYALEDRPKGQGRVQAFTSDGSFVTTFGRGQMQSGSFSPTDGCCARSGKQGASPASSTSRQGWQSPATRCTSPT
jgi:hypothetical protein